MNEVWKTIPGHPLYQASSLGRIRSVAYIGVKHNKTKQSVIYENRGKVLKPYINKKGYAYNQLGVGRENRKETHYFIVITFLGPRLLGFEVNHKNGIKADNRLENLEWVTRGENIRHAFANNLNHSGSKHGISKLNEEQVFEIKKTLKTKERRCKPFYSDIAKKYGVDRKTIESIAKNKTWRQI